MKSKSITNLLAVIFLIMGVLMWCAWYYMAVFKHMEVVGLKSSYIFYAFGTSLVLFLVPEDKIKEILIKYAEKKAGIDE